MLSWRKATKKPHAALPLAPIFCFASQPYHYPLLLQTDLEVFIRATIPNTSWICIALFCSFIIHHMQLT